MDMTYLSAAPVVFSEMTRKQLKKNHLTEHVLQPKVTKESKIISRKYKRAIIAKIERLAF